MAIVAPDDCCWKVTRCRNEIIFKISGGFVGVLRRFYWTDDVALDRDFGGVSYPNGGGWSDHCGDNLIVTVKQYTQSEASFDSNNGVIIKL